MNEIRDLLLAGSAIYTKALFEITVVRRFDCGKPTHIYKKRDFDGDNSMGKGRNVHGGCIMQLVVYYN